MTLDGRSFLIGEALKEIVEESTLGRKKIKIGLMLSNSELGPGEAERGAQLAMEIRPDIEVVFLDSVLDAEEKGGNMSSDKLIGFLKKGEIQGAVALHYPFPLGVATIGRVLSPAKGKPVLIASSTGSSATQRIEAMIRNAIYGIAVAKTLGLSHPSVGVLNVEGAQLVLKALKQLESNGYPIIFGESARREGGPILRGNDLLTGSVDLCVTDTLTGNILVKLLSAYSGGGLYETLGWGYGPSVGEGWPYVVSIVSRASGAPVIGNAILFTAMVAERDLPRFVEEELQAAYRMGLREIINDALPKTSSLQTKGLTFEKPLPEPTDEEIYGIDVLLIDDAVQTLWKNGIYAEAAMGCTGPVVKLSSRKKDEAESILKKEGFL